jgi:hypothetical protein
MMQREIDRLTAERDAAFAMSRCECGTDEACAELAKLREQLALAESVRAAQVAGLTEGMAKLRERNRLEMAGIVQVIATHANNLQNFAGNLDAAIDAALKGEA